MSLGIILFYNEFVYSKSPFIGQVSIEMGLYKEGPVTYFNKLFSEAAEQFLEGNDTIPRDLKRVNEVPLMRLATNQFIVLFKNGIIQSVYGTRNGIDLGGIKDFLPNYYGDPYFIINQNYKKEVVENSFNIISDEKETGYDLSDADLDSSCIATKAFLFVHPFINALFAIAIKTDTNTPVIINCLNVDTSPFRRVLGIPENKVIPCKEGEYIEIPVIENNNKSRSRSVNRDAIKAALIARLQSELAKLTGESNTETTDTTEITD